MLLFFIVLPPVSFRPLSGSYISQLNSHICSLNVCGLFPSPIGELHFSILDIRETERVEYTVSVPYRGATFLNIFCKYVKNTDYRVSVPYRGATFLNCEHGPDIKSVGGFRPLSGSYISQFVFNEASGIQTATVSVPYRGATFLNSIFRFYKRATDSFPSPIGELHFSISLSLFSFIISQFPSPIGELHFSMLSVNPKNELLFAFPSPIGELHFSIPSPQPHVLSGTNRGIAGEK